MIRSKNNFTSKQKINKDLPHAEISTIMLKPAQRKCKLSEISVTALWFHNFPFNINEKEKNFNLSY